MKTGSRFLTGVYELSRLCEFSQCRSIEMIVESPKRLIVLVEPKVEEHDKNLFQRSAPDMCPSPILKFVPAPLVTRVSVFHNVGRSRWLWSYSTNIYAVLIAVNGGWSAWQHWQDCNATCGTGLMVRKRYCNNPPPAYNGNDCGKNNSEYRTCSIDCTGTPRPQ